MIDDAADPRDARILVLAPTPRDAATSQTLLRDAGLAHQLCGSMAEVCREAERGVGAAVVTAEAVLGEQGACLGAWLKAQPPWSDLPLVVLTPPGPESPRLLPALDAVGAMTLMKRPVHVAALLSTLRAALRDRQRQYAVRDLLAERRQAAETLRAERERYRVTLASIGDAVIATSPDGGVTFLNAVAEQLTGWTAASACGRPLAEVFQVIDETTWQPAPNPALRALDEGAIVGLTDHTILRARDGTPRPIDDSAAPIRDEAGATVGAVLVFRDVTAQRRAAAALRESEERQRQLADNLPAGFIYQIVCDGDHSRRFSYVSGGVQALSGVTPAEIMADPARLYALIAAEDAERVRATEQAALQARQLFDCQFRLRRGDQLRWLRCRAAPRRDPGGAAVWDGLAIDVTEHVLAEARYREAAAAAATAAEANAKFRAFFEQGTNFAGVLALDGTVVEANRLCLDACGFTRADVIGRPFWECGWWSRSAPLVDMVRAACRQAAAGELFRTESNYFLADGSERVVDLIVAPVTDAAGRVLFVAATGTDITARRHMEDVLREADRKKDDFIALLAHELRNPLAPIRNGLQVMRLAHGDSDAIAQARGMMDRQLGHMVRLIDDLLDVSRISRNKMQLRRGRVLLADVVSNAVETARPVIEAAGHELIVALPPAPIYLDADLTRLAQVFSNLLTNSAKYTERGGSIRLTADCVADEVIVAVQDTGIGMPAAALPTVFDMFSQVDRSMERSTGGLGIGLALVKGLTEMHGGTVSAASAGPGAGSTFTVRLPAPGNQHEPPLPLEPTAAARSGDPQRLILVVDDNRDSAESMALMLQLLGHRTVTAHDGVSAVAAAARVRPEVILMDMGMPRLNGLDATRQIKAQPWGRDIVVVALTGWGQESDRQRSRAAGCAGHLVKPVSLPDLEKLLAALTANRDPLE